MTLTLNSVGGKESGGERAEIGGRVMVGDPTTLYAHGHQLLKLMLLWVPQTDAHGPH